MSIFSIPTIDLDIQSVILKGWEKEKPIEPYTRHLLSTEAKKLLENIPEKYWVSVLAEYTEKSTPFFSTGVPPHVVPILRTDLILLLGYSHGELGVSTTIPNVIADVTERFTMTTNSTGYGINKLEEKQPVIETKGYKKVVKCFTSYFDYKVKVTDTYIRVSRFLENCWLNKKTGSIGRRTTKNKSYHLFYFFEDGKIKISKHNVKLFTVPKEIQHDNTLYHLFLDVLEENKVKYNYPILRKSGFRPGMRALRNPLWMDLNVVIKNGNPVESLHIKYSTLKYHYDKYGTRALREKFIGSSNKQIQRFLSQDYQRIKAFNLLKKAKLDHLFDPNNLEVFINNHNIDIRCVDVVQILLKYNYNLKKIINFRNPYIFNDISGLYFRVDRLLRDNQRHLLIEVMNPKNSITAIHDGLAHLHRNIRDANYLREIPLLESQSILAYDTDNYMFIPSNHTQMLLDLGTKLNICVASYDMKALSGNITIVGVYDKVSNNPIACIEVTKDNDVVQAKLSRNQPLKTNEGLLEITKQWLSEKRLTTSGYDISPYPSFLSHSEMPF